MGIEIERKFLIKNEEWKNAIDEKIELKQGYLNSIPERTVRVRIKGDKGYLTIKGKSKGASRAEYEYEIPLIDARELIGLCEKPVIEKIRFIVKENNKIWEIDVFDGENKGLIVAEVELENENDAIQLPNWIGKEVTQEPKYYNSNLVKHPFCKW